MKFILLTIINHSFYFNKLIENRKIRSFIQNIDNFSAKKGIETKCSRKKIWQIIEAKT